jgi:hypothetical protein
MTTSGPAGKVRPRWRVWQPTGLDVLVVAIGLVLVLAIIEFLSQAPEQVAPVEMTPAENLPAPIDGASRAAEHGSALPVPAKRE